MIRRCSGFIGSLIKPAVNKTPIPLIFKKGRLVLNFKVVDSPLSYSSPPILHNKGLGSIAVMVFNFYRAIHSQMVSLKTLITGAIHSMIGLHYVSGGQILLGLATFSKGLTVCRMGRDGS